MMLVGSKVGGNVARDAIGVPISFGKTLPQLLGGGKSVTRRVWKGNYARIFINAFNAGKLVPAFDKDRRYGGKLIGFLRLTDLPKLESIYDMPISDLEKEGFPELSWREFIERFFKGCLGEHFEEER